MLAGYLLAFAEVFLCEINRAYRLWYEKTDWINLDRGNKKLLNRVLRDMQKDGELGISQRLKLEKWSYLRRFWKTDGELSG